jgi:nucleoside-diphosphate-sugar epimerase
MGTVVITGADASLAERVIALAAVTASATDRVVAVADCALPGLPAGVDVRRLDLATDDLKPTLEGASALLHLAQSVPADAAAATADVDVVRRVLDAAGSAGVGHVVVLSSATVYGAWANNPVPLTEEATLRPNPGFAFAAERAEIERLAAEWRDEHPSATVAVLRPVRVAAPGGAEWLPRALKPSPAVPEGVDEPPVQFVHVDDLASAVEVAWRERLDGAYNVAPDGSIPADEVRSLTGAPPKVRLPDRVVRRLVGLVFRSGIGPTPPELLSYTLHPWVVANDRLRAAGWAASFTNEEACVEAHEAGPIATLSPKRRQELLLGGSGLVLASVAVGVGLVVRRLLRSRVGSSAD